MTSFYGIAAVCSLFLCISGCTKKSKSDDAGPTNGDSETSPDDPLEPGHRPTEESEFDSLSPTLFGPITLHILFTKGSIPERRQLVYAKKMADTSWSTTMVIDSNDDRQLVGRATMQIDERGPAVTYTKYVATNLERPRLDFTLAESTDGTLFTTRSVLSGSRPETASISGAIGPLRHGKNAVAILSKTNGESSVVTINLSGGEVIPHQVEASQTSITDAAITTNREGITHALFIKDQNLQFAQQKTDGTFGLSEMSLQGCNQINFIALAEATDSYNYTLVGCTNEISSEEKECRLLLSYGKSNAERSQTELATLDAKHACTPFAADRPSLAVDQQGRAHIAFRHRSYPSLDWKIGYIVVSSDRLSLIHTFEDSGAQVGFAHVAVDGRNDPYVGWMNGNTIKLASSDVRGVFQTNTVHFPAETGENNLTLSAFIVTGGLQNHE